MSGRVQFLDEGIFLTVKLSFKWLMSCHLPLCLLLRAEFIHRFFQICIQKMDLSFYQTKSCRAVFEENN